MKKIIVMTILMFSFTSNLNYIGKSNAHNFSTDDNSSILTLINQIVIQNDLLYDSISNNSDLIAKDNISSNNNKSYSFENIENIENILEDILIAEQSFTVESNQFYNNTVVALVVANLADDVLRNYGYAYGIPSNIMLNMNFSNINNVQNNSNGINIINNSSMHSGHLPGHENTISNMIDIPSYHVSLETADRMIEIYDEDLKGFSSNIDYVNNAIDDLGDALFDLRKDIEMHASPSKIMENVHGGVHPDLQMAFNLTLNPFL